MPTVPLYSPGNVTPLATRGRVTVQGTAASFGGLQGAALAGAGRDVSAGAREFEAARRRIQRREDDDNARRAYTAYSDQARQALHDPDSGYYSRYGHDAKGITQQAHEQLGQIADNVARELTTDQARRTYQALVLSARQSSLNGLARHEHAQLRTSELEGLKAGLESSVQNSVANYTDEPALMSEMRRGEALVRSVAAAQGLGDDWVQNEVQQYRSQVHDGVVQRMLVDDPTSAREYLAKHHEEISASRLPILEKAVRESSTRQRGQEAVDSAFAVLEVDPAFEELSAGQRRDLLESARSIDNPEVRDAAVRRTEARIAQYDRVYRQAQGERLDTAWAGILQGAEVEDIDPTLWAQLEPSKQKAIIDYTAARAKRTGSQATTPEGWVKMEQLNELFNADRDALAEMNLSQFFHMWSPADRNRMMNLKRSAGDKTLKAADKAERDRVSRSQVVWEMNQQLLARGINPNPAKKDKAANARVARIRVSVWNAVSEFQDQKGGIATDEERARIIAGQLTPGTIEIEGLLKFDQDEAVFAETVGDPRQGRRFVVREYDDIPTAERTQIETIFERQTGAKPTQDQVEDFYSGWVVERRSRGEQVRGIEDLAR